MLTTMKPPVTNATPHSTATNPAWGGTIAGATTLPLASATLQETLLFIAPLTSMAAASIPATCQLSPTSTSPTRASPASSDALSTATGTLKSLMATPSTMAIFLDGISH